MTLLLRYRRSFVSVFVLLGAELTALCVVVLYWIGSQALIEVRMSKQFAMFMVAFACALCAVPFLS